MRRSGHHAIINWTCKQLPGKTIFINNFRSWLEDHDSYRCIFEYRDGSIVRRKGVWSDISFCDTDNLVYNFEDVEFADSFAITPDKAIKVLVLRDAPNMLASRMKSPGIPNENWRDLWVSNAHSFLNEKQLTSISFNEWQTKIFYRKNVSSRLGLKFNDAGFNDVMDIGGGSSFEGLDVNFKQLFKRYKDFLSSRLMRDLARDDVVMKLNRQIFGLHPILL